MMQHTHTHSDARKKLNDQTGFMSHAFRKASRLHLCRLSARTHLSRFVSTNARRGWRHEIRSPEIRRHANNRTNGKIHNDHSSYSEGRDWIPLELTCHLNIFNWIGNVVVVFLLPDAFGVIIIVVVDDVVVARMPSDGYQFWWIGCPLHAENLFMTNIADTHSTAGDEEWKIPGILQLKNSFRQEFNISYDALWRGTNRWKFEKFVMRRCAWETTNDTRSRNENWIGEVIIAAHDWPSIHWTNRWAAKTEK